MKNKTTYLEELIEKYSKRHKKLAYQLDSDLLNMWQIELIMLELEAITDFLKDLRLIKANNE